MRSSLLLVLIAAIPSFAGTASMRLSGKTAPDTLKLFIAQDSAIKARLDDAAQREEAFVSAFRDPDMHDAVSDSSSKLREALIKEADACTTPANCKAVEFDLKVPDSSLLPDAIARMTRPWLVLQRARKAGVEVSAVEGGGDAVLSMRLEGLEAEPLVLNVTPQELGGFELWFSRPVTLASLYQTERTALLKRNRN